MITTFLRSFWFCSLSCMDMFLIYWIMIQVITCHGLLIIFSLHYLSVSFAYSFPINCLIVFLIIYQYLAASLLIYLLSSFFYFAQSFFIFSLGLLIELLLELNSQQYSGLVGFFCALVVLILVTGNPSYLLYLLSCLCLLTSLEPIFLYVFSLFFLSLNKSSYFQFLAFWQCFLLLH